MLQTVERALSMRAGSGGLTRNGDRVAGFQHKFIAKVSNIPASRAFPTYISVHTLKFANFKGVLALIGCGDGLNRCRQHDAECNENRRTNTKNECI